jgi:xylulokinase
LKADVMNRPIRTLEVTEAACLGVAMLACAAHTKTSPRELAKVWAKQGPAIKPDARRAAYYTERFAAYRGLYPAIRDFWQRSVPGKKS